MREWRGWGQVMQGLVCYGEDFRFHPKGDGSLEGCEQRVAMCMLGSLLWLLGGFGGKPLGRLAVSVSSTSGTLWTSASFWDPRIGAMPSCISEILESFLNPTGISSEVWLEEGCVEGVVYVHAPPKGRNTVLLPHCLALAFLSA